MKTFDAVIVGAGFSGMYMLHRLRGLGLSVLAVEAAGDVGGTWYWNRYPGARCDVESLSYSYSFDDALQQEWEWKERYAPQPEILEYARHVAERFDLKRDIRFNTRIVRAAYREPDNLWTLECENGDEIEARFCIMATGCLSVPRAPDIPGLADFEGTCHHTGLWPHEPVDFKDKRVGVVGTGSSAIQSIPVIAQHAAHVVVFQRTAHYSAPAWNGPLGPEFQAAYKAKYGEYRRRMRESESGILYDTHEINLKSAAEVPGEEREGEFEKRWLQGGFNFQNTFADLTRNQASNDLYVDFVHRKIRATVDDPEIAEKLCPTAFPLGTKRMCVDTDYYATFNRDNVELVDVGEEPIVRVTRTGIETAKAAFELDIIELATGFDAVTGALLRMNISGRAGHRLEQDWESEPRALLGLAVHGYPNMFTITGPGSPSVFTNMLVAIEQDVEWIAGCIGYLREHGYDVIEADRDAQDAWSEHVTTEGMASLYPKANSWYMGANIPGKPRTILAYIGGMVAYKRKCAEVADNGYEGFTLRRSRELKRAG